MVVIVWCQVLISITVICKGLGYPGVADKSNSSLLLPDYNSRTVSAISDDEPLYDVVASDEDYSSIDSQSIKSMRDELKRDRPAEVGMS